MNMSDAVGMGAEAVIEETEFLGYRAVRKMRPAKGYRHPDLDRRLRAGRTKNEVKVIHEARMAGVRTPVIYDVDLSGGTIVMEFIEGTKVKDIIDNDPERSESVCRMIGSAIARLHNAGICHGDLTTSNMILTDKGELCIFDFSLGSVKCDLEGKGVDIHLLERAFSSSHSESESSFGIIMDSYRSEAEGASEIMKRVENIKGRARYT